MRTNGRFRQVSFAVVVTAMVAAGCGDDGDSASGSDGDSDEENTRWDGRAHTPLDVFMGYDDDFDSEDDSWIEDERAIQELVVDCMREEGFEYVPYVPDYDTMVGEGDGENDEAWDLMEEAPAEYAATYGYGITTMDELGGEAFELDDGDDPNQAVVEEMSDAEREAYEEALWGNWEEVEGDLGELEGEVPVEIREPAPEDRGCMDEASSEIWGDGEESEADGEDGWDVYDDAWQTIDQQIADDPDVAAALADYVGCMAVAGHSGIEEIWDAQDLVWERVDELPGMGGGMVTDAGAGGGRVVTVEGEDVASGEGGDGDEGSAEAAGDADPDDAESTEDSMGSMFEDVDPDELEELQEYEIEVAVADQDCLEESDYEQVEYDVRVRVEQDYIDANQEELEQARDALELDGGAQG